MTIKDIKALTFDTGGTILDWHTGFKTAFQAAGKSHGIERDWTTITNELRKRFMVCSFTILSYWIIMDTARRNGLSWDAVFSCEGIGKYKILPESYETVARMLQLDVSECLMVACHNFDLDAAKAVGFNTAFVRRPDEWGPPGPPDPNPHHDIIVDTFPQLAEALGCRD